MRHNLCKSKWSRWAKVENMLNHRSGRSMRENWKLVLCFSNQVIAEIFRWMKKFRHPLMIKLTNFERIVLSHPYCRHFWAQAPRPAKTFEVFITNNRNFSYIFAFCAAYFWTIIYVYGLLRRNFSNVKGRIKISQELL